jgi:hypothetical protein
MRRLFTSLALANRIRPALATACAGLVLALTVFAASPVAHQWLHVSKADAGRTDAQHPAPKGSDVDGCAVVLFASGVALPVGPIAVTPPAEAVQGVSPVTAAEVFLVSPRYLRQPERGPPAGWVS